MPVVDADLVWYGSAVMPDDDTTLQIGGAIDLSKILIFTALIDPATTLEMLSTAADVRNVTITYLTTGGSKATETKALNGVTPVAFTATMAYILKVVIASANSNTVTIRKSGGGATLVTMGANVTEARILFYENTANPTGGATKHYWDKGFLKNTHPTSGVTTASIGEQAEPGSLMEFGLAATLGDSGTNGAGNNRQVAPAAITFDSNSKAIVGGGTLGAGQAQGVWFHLTLTAGQSPVTSTFTMRLSGVAS